MREFKFRAWVASGTFVGMYYEEFTRYLGSFGVQFAQFQEWPDALMQYTGLKDKNGREIYEGDIVKAPEHDANYEVIYDRYAFTLKDFWDGSYDVPSDGLSEQPDEIEVIGNVYQNKDLLK